MGAALRLPEDLKEIVYCEEEDYTAVSSLAVFKDRDIVLVTKQTATGKEVLLSSQ